MLRERGQTSTTSCNIQNVARKIWPFSNLIQYHPTCCNTSQHITTGLPNVRNMLCPTMLQDVVLKCCERLARPLNRYIWEFRVVIWQTTSKNCTKVRAARAARLFSSFIQSDHCFLALLLPLLSSLLKLPNESFAINTATLTRASLQNWFFFSVT